MSVTVISRTEVTQPPDITRRARTFLIAITYTALLVTAVGVLPQQRELFADRLLIQLGALSAIAVWWTIRLRAMRARWFDLAVDFVLLATLTATAPVPESTLGVYFPGVLLRSLYEGRRIAFVRPAAFAGALGCGLLAGMSLMELPADTAKLVLTRAPIPILVTGGIAGALAQLILSHKIALEQESDLLALSTRIAGDHQPEAIAREVAESVRSLASRTCGADSKALVVLSDNRYLRVVDEQGEILELDPVGSTGPAATNRHFGETIAHSLKSIDSLASERSGNFCTIAPFGGRGSNRGAIALCTPTAPSRILRNGLRLAAENTGLAVEGADLNSSLEDSNQRRSALLSEVVTASEDQRANLAGDLHDGPIQSLTALTFEIDFSDDLLESGEIDGARRALRAMKHQLFNEINRLRQTMTKLLPPTLSERGIEKALRDYTRQQAAASEGIRFSFESDITVRPPEAAERMLYRVAQEALANAIRHARATRIDVGLVGDDEGMRITISDNGRGFDTEQVTGLISRDRFGIASMQHIMEMIGGALEITSSAAAGTTIQMTIPIAPGESQSISDEIPATT
ncbi:MAG: hypothetical protein DCC49_05605 [Acidobacteria bacterium]|nr:MAG: hypothetical protein DCC49_05605 [Acidobacteriota bacterium]